MSTPFDWSKQRLEDRRFLTLKYAESHRFYHDTPHPENVFGYCLELWNRYGPAGRSELEFFQTTCAWHDAIYVVGEKNNEIESARAYLRSSTCELQHEGLRIRVSAAIEASANHCAGANGALPLESKCFLDADMYELASEWELFDHNSDLILKEFSCVYHEYQIMSGRRKFFRALLAAPQIYWVAKDREAKARANLQRGIDEIDKYEATKCSDLDRRAAEFENPPRCP